MFGVNSTMVDESKIANFVENIPPPFDPLEFAVGRGWVRVSSAVLDLIRLSETLPAVLALRELRGFMGALIRVQDAEQDAVYANNLRTYIELLDERIRVIEAEDPLGSFGTEDVFNLDEQDPEIKRLQVDGLDYFRVRYNCHEVVRCQFLP
jgi:hypothetical protein